MGDPLWRSGPLFGVLAASEIERLAESVSEWMAVDVIEESSEYSVGVCRCDRQFVRHSGRWIDIVRVD